jgi:hypothetical protein
LQIALNAGREDGQVILRDISCEGGCLSVMTLPKTPSKPTIVDMFEAGIIDPVKVTRSCIENAASAAAVLLTTEAAVAEIPEEKKAPKRRWNAGDGGHGLKGRFGLLRDVHKIIAASLGRAPHCYNRWTAMHAANAHVRIFAVAAFLTALFVSFALVFFTPFKYCPCDG